MKLIKALILAAGEGSRLGQPKALLSLNDSIKALDQAIHLFQLPEIDQVIVVLGARSEIVKAEFDLDPVIVCVNEQYQQGMLSSFQSGLRAVDGDYDYVLIHQVDMPLVRQETIQSLVLRAHVSDAPLILPYYQNRSGHPIVINKDLTNQMLSLEILQTPRTVISKYKDEADYVCVDDPGILFDVDTQEDLKVMHQVLDLTEKHRAQIDGMILGQVSLH